MRIVQTKEKRTLEDRQIVEGLKSGRESAVLQMVAKYLPQLKAFLTYLKAPESIVDDIIQEAFLKAIKKISSYDESRSFSAWLMMISRNQFYDEIRKEKARSNRERLSAPSRSYEHVFREDNVVAEADVSELIGRMAITDQFLLELRVFQEMSFVEIAELTGEPEGTLRSRFCRLMKKLKQEFKPADE